MPHTSIDREIHIDASPDVVFDVLTSPEHIREWWNGAETDLAPTAGSVAEIAWGRTSPEPHVERLTVVEADRPRRFAFRWVAEGASTADASNSLLATFELVPDGGGTTVRFSETGYDEKAWDTSDRGATFAAHTEGWDRFVPGLGDYVGRLVSAS